MTTSRRLVDHAPFGADGSLLRKADGVHEWRPAPPFRTSLTLRAPKRGGSRTYVIWQDPQGRRYPMSYTTLTDLLLHSSVSNGVTVGWWAVTKRNMNYEICRLSVDQVARS